MDILLPGCINEHCLTLPVYENGIAFFALTPKKTSPFNQYHSLNLMKPYRIAWILCLGSLNGKRYDISYQHIIKLLIEKTKENIGIERSQMMSILSKYCLRHISHLGKVLLSFYCRIKSNKTSFS